jgi:hypothetical protein
MENPKHPKKMKIIFSIGNLTQLFPYLQINVCPANIYIYIKHPPKCIQMRYVSNVEQHIPQK